MWFVKYANSLADYGFVAFHPGKLGTVPMADETQNIVLEHLRHIRGRVDHLSDEMRNMNVRMAAIEGHMASLVTGGVGQNSEIDRLKRRVDRIELRLELTDTPD